MASYVSIDSNLELFFHDLKEVQSFDHGEGEDLTGAYLGSTRTIRLTPKPRVETLLTMGVFTQNRLTSLLQKPPKATPLTPTHVIPLSTFQPHISGIHNF